MDNDFQQFLNKEQKKINRMIKDFYANTIKQEEEPFLRKFLEFGQHFVLQGGRRIHPIVLVETFKGLASQRDILDFSDEVYNVSIASELLHVSSLMIDDLVENSEFRRGKKTFHRFMGENFENQPEFSKEFASATTIYGGNMTTFFGSKIITNSHFDSKRKAKALQMYLNGLAGVTRGHLLDEYFKQAVPLEKISLENYLILADKRAKQMETSAGLGALFGNARSTQLEPLMKAVNKIGIIAQMRNDINGSFGDPNLRSIDEDIKSGQTTILTVLGYQQSNKEQKEAMNRILGKSDATPEEIKQVREIFKDSGALNFVKMYSNSLKNDVYNSLHKIYPGLRQDVLDFYEQLLEYIINYRG
ncbi:MAG: polyprenyl synthetase family protein [Promethearchaeota archaeon]